MPIQTDREINANRPEIVIKNKKEKGYLLIDMKKTDGQEHLSKSNRKFIKV